MKRILLFSTTLLTLLFAASACRLEEVGPYEEVEQTIALSNFDQLDMGSAFRITVLPGATFRVVVRGNRRDVDDLEVYTRNGTLNARYRNNGRRRRYTTYFNITMPTVRGVNFSGASNATVSGFRGLQNLSIKLTGASKADFAIEADRTTVDLSGASKLDLEGDGAEMQAQLSGASTMHAYKYPVDEARLDVSGASNAEVRVVEALTVDASGASSVRYRGNPVVRERSTGASSVRKE